MIKLNEESAEFKEIKENWYKEAKEMTLEKLPAFLKKLTEEYEHDYGTICHAISAAANATAWAVNKTEQGEITEFQAGAITWEFIKHWKYSSNKCGLQLVDYDDMLYPQYENYFEKSISKSIWERLQGQAAKELKTSTNEVQIVKDHWQSIVDGKVPFGYKVRED